MHEPMASKKTAQAAASSTGATGAAVADSKGSAIVVTVQEHGKIATRTFNETDHGGDWRSVAAEFIATCKLDDGEKRAKYVSHAEVK